MKKKLKIWLIVLAAVVAAIVLASIIFAPKEVATIHEETAVSGDIENTVTATGEIQPVYKVEVGTRVSGEVVKMYVDYNSTVKKGQLLAELDKSLLQEQVKQARAELNNSTSSKYLAQKNYDRIKALYDKKAATQEEFDQAETQLEQAKNQLVSAQSNYDNARTNLKYAEIYSPIDGVILSKAVEEGQTVASSFSTPTLFTIAANLTDMQLEAKVDEADIGLVKEGQPVRFTVDAFPGETFSGTVRQIRLVPTVTSNVVTYTVIIDAPNHEGKLYPGMTANITIMVQQQHGIVIPLEATRYEIDADMEQFLVSQGYTLQRVKTGNKADSTTIFYCDGSVIRQKFITTGFTDGALIIVENGLADGEKIIRSISRDKGSASKKDDEEGGLRMGPPEPKKR